MAAGVGLPVRQSAASQLRHDDRRHSHLGNKRVNEHVSELMNKQSAIHHAGGVVLLMIIFFTDKA